MRRFPIGPVPGIAPFNSPLNLVAHKVAPAIGEVPSSRADQMPYGGVKARCPTGGVKASGFGREGLKSAMSDFTFDKVLVLTNGSL